MKALKSGIFKLLFCSVLISCTGSQDDQHVKSTETVFFIDSFKIDKIEGEKAGHFKDSTWKYYSESELIREEFYEDGSLIYLVDYHKDTLYFGYDSINKEQ